jgi:hypothetical protein
MAEEEGESSSFFDSQDFSSVTAEAADNTDGGRVRQKSGRKIGLFLKQKNVSLFADLSCRFWSQFLQSKTVKFDC